MIPKYRIQDPEDWPDDDEPYPDDVADPDEDEEGYPNRLPFPWGGNIGGLMYG